MNRGGITPHAADGRCRHAACRARGAPGAAAADAGVRPTKTMQTVSRRNTQPRIIYLDWNVFVSIRNKQCVELASELRARQSRGTVCAPYSSTHVEELQRYRLPAGGDNEQLQDRLHWLGAFTNNVYLYNGADVSTPVLRKEDPASVHQTINEIPWADEAVDGLISFFRPEHVSAFRKELRVAPDQLNNLKRPGILQQIDELTAHHIKAICGTQQARLTVSGMIDQAMQIHPDGASFGLEHRMAAFFMLMNFVGFWPDKRFADDRRRAPLFDAAHASAASFGDVFVTQDARLRVKADAAYEYFAISTLVMQPNEATEWLRREA